jgi:hypothetical protein
MKWLFTLFLWILALVVALGVLWRIYRGKPVILRGRWTPRVLRMTAVLMVLFGLGAEKAGAAPVPVKDSKGKVEEELPPTVTAQVLQQWIALHQPASEWTQYKHQYTLLLQRGGKPTEAEANALELMTRTLPPKLRGLMLADVKALVEGKRSANATPRELIAVLNEAEEKGFLDPWLTAHLWRKTEGAGDAGERKPLIDLMARLHRHARLANAAIACKFQVRPIMNPPMAWGGKVGRPPQWQQQQIFNQLALIQNQAIDSLKTLKATYAKADIGTWQKDALTLLGIEKGSAPVTLIRAGTAGMPLSEGGIRLGRLDLLETTPGDKPALLLHPVLGRITIPAGKLVSVWDLPRHLSETSRDALKKYVKDALAGNEKAAQQIELMLPFAQPFLREGLKETPAAEGAPRLRLILTQFDDVPAPPAPDLNQLQFYQGIGGLNPGIGGGRGRFGPR